MNMMERKAYMAFGKTGFGEMGFGKTGRHRSNIADGRPTWVVVVVVACASRSA